VIKNQSSPPDSRAESDEPTPAKHKRKISVLESCVRTDKLRLMPHAGKSTCLDRLFDAYRDASVVIADILWTALLEGADPIAWKLVAAPNPLAGRSTILQPAEAQAKGQLKSHLGWLKKDVGKSISKMVRRLKYQAAKQGLKEEKLQACLIRIEAFAHELRAVNARSAWRWGFGSPRGSDHEERRQGPAVGRVSAGLRLGQPPCRFIRPSGRRQPRRPARFRREAWDGLRRSRLG
jgi:hypothetical protein